MARVYLKFELSLHGMGVKTESEQRLLMDQIIAAVREVAATHKDRFEMTDDVELELIESAGALE
jgi:hypothetical protein